MRYFFFTDVHLGLRRSSHTSAKSLIALQDHIFETAYHLVQREKESGARVFNLGDLFDRHSNEERIIRQGGRIARLTDRTLGGNHDMINIVDAVGSLTVVRDFLDDGDGPRVVMAPDPGKPYSYTEVNVQDGVTVTFVPHVLTQEVFERSLVEACDLAKHENKKLYNILCLHCNVGDMFHAAEAEGSSLCLTTELERMVCGAFDLVLLGHDHHPRVLNKGKLVVLGNLYPVTFGEIEDRFVWHFDTVTKKLEREQVFDASTQYGRFEVDVLLETDDFEEEVELLEIIGTIQPHNFPALTRAIQKLWKTNPGLFAIKNSVEIDRPESAKKDRTPDFIPRTLRERVGEAVVEAGYSQEYAELVREVGE